MYKVAEPDQIHSSESDGAVLSGDKRWLLVQRILASAGFQRAEQLRKILVYISVSAILHPEETIREYQIACEVLGRRSDFDPVSDNIVRAQMSHLRRKLETYCLEEGQSDLLRLTIPKGSYHPQFVEVPGQPSSGGPELEPVPVAAPKPDRGHEPRADQPRGWTRLQIALIGLTACLLALVFALSWKLYEGPGTKLQSTPAGNAFIRFLHRSPGNVTVVMPDTSFMLLQKFLQTELSAQEYAQSDYLLPEIAAVKDPALREVLSQLRSKRNTSIGETYVAMDLLHELAAAGVSSSLRYARDLHVRDLNEGSTILIGSHTSNPWNSLFNERMNFRFHQYPRTNTAVFENLKPLQGEQAQYIPYENQGGKISSYIDVALTTNATKSGYILLFDGSDSAAVEAGARFMLHGKLPRTIEDLLDQDDLSYFEIFLRGVHTDADAEETFEVVGVRSTSK